MMASVIVSSPFNCFITDFLVSESALRYSSTSCFSVAVSFKVELELLEDVYFAELEEEVFLLALEVPLAALIKEA